MGLRTLLAVRRHLRRLPDAHGVVAVTDPTMMFSGLLWGRRVGIKRGLLDCFWLLKPCLFQCGDRYVEAVTSRLGVRAFRDDFAKNRSDDRFYGFGPDLEIDEARPDLEGWRAGTRAVEEALVKRLPEAAAAVRSDWIRATNDALESVFYLDDWSQAWSRGDGALLDELSRAEEEQKNVRVVTTLVRAGRHVEAALPYAGREEDIIRACSRWFTLIDDRLDLEEDVRTGQPNRLSARLVIEGEVDRYTSDGSCPQTLEWYAGAYAEAVDGFLKTFPVWPGLFRRRIESRARDSGASPF